MTTPRRRLVRAAPPPARPRPQGERRLQKLRARLEAERAVLTRWFGRLQRAFHTVDRTQATSTRLERQIAREE